MTLEGDVDGDVAGARRRLHVLDRGGDLLGRVEPLPLDLQLARRHPRHVEQVGDQLGLDAGVALDGVDARDHVGVAAGDALLEQLRPADDGVERRPQLVRQRRQEVVLHLVGALGLGPRRGLAGQEPLPLGLDLAPVGDVGGDGEADARAGMDRDAPIELDVPAVRVQHWQRAAPRSGGGERGGDLLDQVLRAAGVERGDVLADDVGAVAPERRAHRRIHLEEDHVVAEQGDAVQRLVEDRLELRLALAQRVLGAAGAEERVDGRDEHRRLDRMRDVAVGAGVESLHLVDVVDEGRGEVDDRRARRLRRRPAGGGRPRSRRCRAG